MYGKPETIKKFQGSRQQEERICSKAAAEFNEYCQAVVETRTANGISQSEAAPAWQPPPHGVIKINVDEAFVKETAKGSMGFVIRDERGNIMEMKAIPFPVAHSAEMMEAMGFRNALASIQSMGSCNVIVEGDAQKIIRMLEGVSSISATLNVVILDTLALARNFQSCSFSFIPRTCNRVAHLIATYMPHLFDSPWAWLGDFPIWAQAEASLDVSLVD